MAKKVTGLIRLQIPAGAANPAPPIGPALGAAGCNIMEFCKQFNAATQAQSQCARNKLSKNFYRVLYRLVSSNREATPQKAI